MKNQQRYRVWEGTGSRGHAGVFSSDSPCLPAHSPHGCATPFWCFSVHVFPTRLTAGSWPPPSLRRLGYPAWPWCSFIFTPTYHHLYIHPSCLLSKFYCIHVNKRLPSTSCVQRNVDIEMKSCGRHSQWGRPLRWPVQTAPWWQQQRYVHGTGAT